VRTPYATRLKKAKADILRYKKSAKDIQAQSARSDLIGSGAGKRFGADSDDPYGERSDRMRLLAGTQTLDDGSRRLQESQRIALETEDVGADTLRELRRQREQIENARDTVSD
jgi:vesicle transport through interaction with t-SNAREs 1